MNYDGTIIVTLLVCDEPTPQTGHIFPTYEVSEAVDKYMSRDMRLGTNNTNDLNDIPLDSFSHQVHKMWMDGPKLKAEISMLESPQGNVLLDVMRAGASIRFAPVGAYTNLIDGKVMAFDIQHTVAYIGEEDG